MKVFAVTNVENQVARIFSSREAAEAFIATLAELEEAHNEWVFSPRSQHEDFIAPDDLDIFIGYGCGYKFIDEFELH